MNTIDIFPWDDTFKTGLAQVDDQHRVLVELLNDLARRAMSDMDDRKLEQVFGDLMAYAEYHFSAEEAIWAEFMPGDAAEVAHREQHGKFAQEIAALHAGGENKSREELAQDLLEYLTSWLAAHILQSDRYMAAVVAAMQEGADLAGGRERARVKLAGANQALIKLTLSVYEVLSKNSLQLMREFNEHRRAHTAMLQAQAALQESRALLQTIVDAVPVRIFWKDIDLKYLGCNPAFAHDAGKEHPADIVGCDDYSLGWAPQADRYRADDREVIASGEPKLSFEEPQTTPNGETVWLRSSKVPLRDASDKIVGVVGVYSDITSRKAEREALQENEERLRLALGAANQAWFDFDVGTGAIRVSPNYPQMIGYAPEEFATNLANWFNEIHPEDRIRMKAAFDQCLEHGGPVTLEYRRRTKSGAWLWIESVGKVVGRDAEGRPLRMIGIHRDISERRRAREEQDRLNRALRLLSECNLALGRGTSERQLLLDVCRLVVDKGGYRMAWVGYAENDPGKSVHPVAQFGVEQGYLDNIRVSWDAQSEFGSGPTGLAIRTGKTQTVQNVLADQAMNPWRAAAAEQGFRASVALPMRTDGEVIGVVNVYAADIDAFSSDEVGLLEELASNLAFGVMALRARQQRDFAEAANRAKSAFLANMSHELRTPLNAISGMVHFLKRSGVTQEQSGRLEKIDAASQHLLGVINAVLDLSKIEAGRMELADEMIDLRSILESALLMVQDRARQKSIALHVSEMAPLPPLRGDPTRLRQAVLNYLSNALKFTEQGSVTLACRVLEASDDDMLVRIEVTDTGIGLAPDALARLYSPFEQGDNSVTRRYGGTGLGLVITRRIAQLMHGDAGAESELGRGSVFWLTVRLKRAAENAVADTQVFSGAADEEELRRTYAGYRILLVEDEPINQEVASLLLEEVDLRVDVADDGLDALAKLADRHYDVILMDMQMPRLDGLEATRRIRALGIAEGTPIIAMTANAFTEDRQRCLDAGMDDFLAKPVDPNDFFAVILKQLKVSKKK